jgi:hypothetical protein
MCSRQYVAQVATGCPGKGKTIAKLLAVVFFLSVSSVSLAKVEGKEQEIFMEKPSQGSSATNRRK